MDITKLDRDDVFDSSGMDMVIFHIDTVAPRAAGDIPREMAESIGRVIMGQPVPRATLERYSIQPIKLIRLDEPPLEELKARYGVVEVPADGNVVPLLRPS